MARTPYKMKGSPHKMGTIEGTSTHKASMAKLAASEIPTAKVDMSRTSGDGTITAAFGEVGRSYILAGIDYGLETGFTVDSKSKGDAQPKAKPGSKTSGIDPKNKSGMVEVMVNGKKKLVKAEDRFKHESVGRAKPKKKT